MANIAAGDITYSLLQNRSLANSKKSNLVQLVFGDGALTYPAGGVPITIAKLGCPVIVESMAVVAQGTSGYKFQYDRANAKLVMIQGDNDGVADGPGNQPSTVAIAAQTIEVEVIGW